MGKVFWISCCLAVLTLISATVARDITLAWDASPSTNVMFYVVSMGTNEGGPYPQQWPVFGRDNTTLTVTRLAPGRYFFVAQAVNASNLWSDFSNQLEVDIPEPPALTLIERASVSLTGVVYRATNVLGPWQELVRLPSVTVPLEGDLGFFRLGLEWSPPPTVMNP